MRKSPSNEDTIIDLLEKCQRNLQGIVLRTEEVVPMSKDNMKIAQKLLGNIQDMLSNMDERLSIRQEVIHNKGGRPRKPTESPLQQYMRKHR